VMCLLFAFTRSIDGSSADLQCLTEVDKITSKQCKDIVKLTLQ